MKNKYLRETRMVDFSNPAIQKLIQNMKWKEMGEFERIKAIYNYVRDDILFGFYLDTILMTEFLLQKYLQTVMDNVIQKELYLWHFYVPAIFHAEYMVLRLIKDCRKEL